MCPTPDSVESVPNVTEGDKISREALRTAQEEDKAISFNLVIKLLKKGTNPVSRKRNCILSKLDNFYVAGRSFS